MNRIRDARDIVRAYLVGHGYGGLFSEAGGCACLADDLAPCCEGMADCEPGYRVDCPGDGCELGGGCDWHVSKEPKNDDAA